jgi:hypothetical protein
VGRGAETVNTRGSDRRLIAAVLLGGGAMLAGCGGGGETARSDAAAAAAEELRAYEAEFRPSDHDQKPEEVFGALKPKAAPDDTTGAQAGPDIEPGPEVVQGYRVQILASPRMEEVRAKKAEAEATFPDEWFYLSYDPPTYKLRAGNFPTRFEADRFMKQLVERGFRDSWIVPERVFRDLPPRGGQAPSPR